MAQPTYYVHNGNGTFVVQTQPRLVLGSAPESEPLFLSKLEAERVRDQLSTNALYVQNPESWKLSQHTNARGSAGKLKE